MGRRTGSGVNDPLGIVLIDKPPGMTSHGVVSRIRRIFNTRRVGHGGTLDPLATGLLTVFIGRATRFVPYLGGGRKVYLSTLTFGESTSTDDADGEVTATRSVPEMTDRDIAACAQRFVGDIDQVPPTVSAVHIDGERAYKKARRGETVEIAPRRVHIESIDVISWHAPDLMIRVTCGSGTYIRSLARDLGEALDTVAHVKTLRREQSGQFNVANAYTLETTTEFVESGTVEKVLIEPGEYLAASLGSKVCLDSTRTAQFGNGVRIEGLTGIEGTTVVFSESGRLLGVGEADDDGNLMPTVVMAPGNLTV
jgi:tRNA pseudouridine55 synthase